MNNEEVQEQEHIVPGDTLGTDLSDSEIHSEIIPISTTDVIFVINSFGVYYLMRDFD